MNSTFEIGRNKVALVDAFGRNQQTTTRVEARQPLRVPWFPPLTQTTPGICNWFGALRAC